MAEPKRAVFLIGPGFIGREVLDRLLAQGYSVTTLVRRESYAIELQQSGARTVLGGLDDRQIIVEQTLAHDIVIHTATADHLPSVQAVIDGIEQRAKQGKKTIFIHTSGTSLISDDARGNSKSDDIFADDQPDRIDALPDTAPHREIDLAIVRSRHRLKDHAKFAIIIPPLIYGYNPSYGRLSIQLPTLTRFAIKHGYAGRIGGGVSVWSEVHVFDLAEAYLILLHWLEQASPDEVVANPYFFAENGREFSWGSAVEVIAKALHKAGKIKSSETTPVPEQQYTDLFDGGSAGILGSNSRSRAVRLRQLGWQPKEKDLFASLTEDEVPAILKETGEFRGYTGGVMSGSS